LNGLSLPLTNKTDANDADGLAQLAEASFYNAVRVKSFDAMLTRTLIGVASISIQLSNQIRGVMKTFPRRRVKGSRYVPLMDRTRVTLHRGGPLYTAFIESSRSKRVHPSNNVISQGTTLG
jgi:transposase